MPVNRVRTGHDLYPVTGLKFGPIALEPAEDFAAWIRAFADQRLLVGCRRGGMTFTIPLVEERLYAWKGRIFLNTKSIPLDGGADDFSDLVPVQDWPAAR